MYGQLPLHQLAHGTRPQLRTVTNLTGTDGFARQTMADNRLSYHSTFVILNSQSFRLQGWWNKVSNLHWMTTQDYSTSKASIAHWRTENGLFFLQAEITTLPKGTKLQTHNTEQGHIGMIAPTATLTPQGPADTGYAGDYWQSIQEDTFHTIKNTASSSSRTTRGLQENNNQTGRHNKVPETLQQQFTTKTQPKSEPQRITPQVIHYNPRTRLREKTTPPTLQESAAPKVQLDKEFHILPQYTLGETTGTEKAGREYMLSLEQRFTYQSRHTTGQTSSDSYLGDRPRYNQLEEKNNIQD